MQASVCPSRPVHNARSALAEGLILFQEIAVRAASAGVAPLVQGAPNMGNASSQEGDLPQEQGTRGNTSSDGQVGGAETNTLLGRLRDIPRAAAITEGKARGKRGTRPHNSQPTQSADFGFIQVRSDVILSTEAHGTSEIHLRGLLSEGALG